jgi:chromosome segregation ATPase
MTISTTSAERTPLPLARRGYDCTQVDAQISTLTHQLHATVAARETAQDQAQALARKLEAGAGEVGSARAASTRHRAETDALRAQIAELSTIPHTVDGMSERLQQMVRITQDEVNDMRRRATSSAAHILTLAQADADELRGRSDTERQAFDTEQRTAQEALRSQLEESRTRHDQLRNESAGHHARLDAELADRRVVTDQQFAAEMEEHRSAMFAELAAHEAARRDDAGRILESAAQQARTQLSDAATETQQVRAEGRHNVAAAQNNLHELRTLQHQVSEQLTAVRALLDWTLPNLP